jgi:hypothetical protein
VNKAGGLSEAGRISELPIRQAAEIWLAIHPTVAERLDPEFFLSLSRVWLLNSSGATNTSFG